MKANAPERLYFFEGETILSARSKKIEDANIEYIRTDAFIEKVCEYMSYHLDTSKIDVNYKYEFIEEIRNYMKGE